MKFSKFVVAALLGLLVATTFSLTADARPRRHAVVRVDPGCNIVFPCVGVERGSGAIPSRRVGRRIKQKAAAVYAFGGGLVSQARQYVGTNPTGWSRAWCGRFMRTVITSAGYRDHAGGNLAYNWRHYGTRVAGPQPGAIASRSGHVSLVTAVHGDGTISVIDGNACGPRGRRHVCEYRVAANAYSAYNAPK
jgi:hypothetical protein